MYKLIRNVYLAGAVFVLVEAYRIFIAAPTPAMVLVGRGIVIQDVLTAVFIVGIILVSTFQFFYCLFKPGKVIKFSVRDRLSIGLWTVSVGVILDIFSIFWMSWR